MKRTNFLMLASGTLIIAGIGFGTAGMMIPPAGDIEESVLVLIGQCFVMAGSFVGIKSMRDEQ